MSKQHLIASLLRDSTQPEDMFHTYSNQLKSPPLIMLGTTHSLPGAMIKENQLQGVKKLEIVSCNSELIDAHKVIEIHLPALHDIFGHYVKQNIVRIFLNMNKHCTR